MLVRPDRKGWLGERSTETLSEVFCKVLCNTVIKMYPSEFGGKLSLNIAFPNLTTVWPFFTPCIRKGRPP